MNITNIFRASARIEHCGYVSIAAVDLFHIEQALFIINIILFLTGALALYRDCALWKTDEDCRAKGAAK